ncbi:MAG TPA: ATP-binding cassette domain-containing protein [Gemmatimonadaceae bacterium]|nr:ATP-binding cassette domain-containing protein [Gemmatimonadaceae bacterium]
MQAAVSQALPVLVLENVSRSFRAGLAGCIADARALDRVSLVVRRGEIVLLTGRRGSGKTTLLHCAAGIMTPDSGRLSWGGLSKRPKWIALATARDLGHAAPTVGESIEESIGSSTHSVWNIDALVTRAMRIAGLDVPRLTSLTHLTPRDRSRLRIARAVTRAYIECGEIRCLLIDGSADAEPLALRANDLHALERQLGCAVIAAANSLGIDGCAVPRTLILEHGRLIADLKHLAIRPEPARVPAKVHRSPVLTDVDPLPALL